MGEAPSTVSLCGLATSLGPHAVRLQEVAAQGLFARECQARGRGRPRQPRGTIAVWAGAAAGVPAQRRARGKRPTDSWACVDAMAARFQSLIAGCAHGWPGRRSAHPLRASPHAATWAEHRLCGAVTCPTRRGLIAGPGRSRRALDSVFALRGRETAGPQAGRVQRAPPLPQRPRGERRCPSSSLRGHPAGPRMPAHIGPGGRTTPTLAREANAGGRGWPTPARGAGARRGPGACGGGRVGWPRAAGPS